MTDRTSIGLFVALALAGCDDKKAEMRAATAAADAGVTVATTPPAPAPTPAPTPAQSAAPDAAAEAKRFDPKHKCPTGQTHFYMEGDFCRKRCFTNADCGKRERCSSMEYPFVFDGGTAGMAKFCEGT